MDNYNLEPSVISDDIKVKKGRFAYNVSAFGLFLFGIVSTFFQVILQIVLVIIAQSDPSIASSNWLNYVFILVPMYVFAFPLTMLFFRIAPKASFEKKKLPVSKLIAYFVMMIPVTFILNLFSIFLAYYLSNGEATNPLNDIVNEINIWQIGTVVILAPIVEEMIFRKLVIDRTRQYGQLLSIVFSALCFSLFHMNLFQIFYAFALGLLLAYIYISTGHIEYTIGLHMAFNFWGSVIPLYITNLVPEKALESMQAGDSASLMQSLSSQELTGITIYGLYLLVELILFIAGIALWIISISKKEFRLEPSSMELPKGKKFTTAFITIGFGFFLALCLYGTITTFLS